MDKESLRTAYKTLRKSLTLEEVAVKSDKITKSFFEYLSQKPDIRHIHVFFSIRRFNEVDTFPLFFKLQEMGYSLYTSEVNGLKDALETLYISDVRDFMLDSWGIPMPLGARSAEPFSIQMVLIPLLAYDRSGNRLGYGKGYYDKFLATLDSNVLKVGLSFFPPEGQIPSDTHDVGLDICITPDQIHLFS
jgi:5-formyltetrahydrofolate cyclo-ligase